MAELLKDKYNYNTLHELAIRVKQVYDEFQVDDFINDIMDKTWDELGLKARMRKIAVNLGKYLPANYETALSIIDKVVAGYPKGFNDYTLMYFSDFVEVYGQNPCYWDLSIAALEKYTVLSSSEFAVRSFILNDEKRMMLQMKSWAKNKNEHIRRLASEGCRPNLPWGKALIHFQQDPQPVIEILTLLKEDSSLYVRKSVANNLNDIAKKHPDLVANLAKDWYGKNKNTDWIVKHGCRSLLKKGNRDVLNIFGFTDPEFVIINNFKLQSKAIAIGKNLIFSFTIMTEKTMKIRLEYGIDYVKANGKKNRKIFQISEFNLEKNNAKQYTKSHLFADMSTRKHYIGRHTIILIVNGEKFATQEFDVLPAKH